MKTELEAMGPVGEQGEWCVVPEPLAPVLAAIYADGLIIASCMTTEVATRIVRDRKAVPALYEALKAVLVMADRGEQPRKLDEALTWRQNDEKARAMAAAALALVDGPQQDEEPARTTTTSREEG